MSVCVVVCVGVCGSMWECVEVHGSVSVVGILFPVFDRYIC